MKEKRIGRGWLVIQKRRWKENSGKGPIQGTSRQYFNKFWWLEGGEKGTTEEVSRWSTR